MATSTAPDHTPLRVGPLIRIAETDAHEGPVYVPAEDALYFTTVRRGTSVQVKRLQLATGRVSVVREDANVANGMALDRDGTLLVCEQGTMATPARITRLDRGNGAVETVVEGGLSSPNDVVVASDGAIWFTDPSYGWVQGFRPAPEHSDRVYRYDAGRLTSVSESLDKPNGLAFSPDERILYVGDSGAPRRVVAFDVVGGALRNERLFADAIPGYPDGLKADADGNVYVSAATGVLVFAPTGELVRDIDLPGAVNFAFGDGRLFVTTDTAVWAAELKGALV
jgi:gluconolactonase